jgi:hypothetical protein
MPEVGDKVTIYTDGDRNERQPFEGWTHFSEYTWTGRGWSMASGVNHAQQGRQSATQEEEVAS